MGRLCMACGYSENNHVYIPIIVPSSFLGAASLGDKVLGFTIVFTRAHYVVVHTVLRFLTSVFLVFSSSSTGPITSLCCFINNLFVSRWVRTQKGIL